MEVLQVKSNVDGSWDAWRCSDTYRYKIQIWNWKRTAPYSWHNSTCKFTSEICMVLFHNVKNMMTGGNGIWRNTPVLIFARNLVFSIKHVDLIIWVFQLNNFDTVWSMCIYSTSYFHSNFTLTRYIAVVVAESWSM